MRGIVGKAEILVCCLNRIGTSSTLDTLLKWEEKLV